MGTLDMLSQVMLIAIHVFTASLLSSIVDDGRTFVTSVAGWVMSLSGLFLVGCVAGRASIMLAELAAKVQL